MALHYFLNEDHTYRECDLMEWSTQFKSTNRKIADDKINGYHISTVWLGYDHNWLGDGPPLLFETMVFKDDGSMQEIYCDRYSTWEEAEAGHKKAIEWVNNGCKDE
jgi:hypothetical protein